MPESVFDTRLPLNINDEDMFPGMTQTPIPRQGWTDMTHTLLRFEISHTLRLINHRVPDIGAPESTGNVISVDEKRKWIEECNNRLERKYLTYCNMEDPMSRVAANTSRLTFRFPETTEVGPFPLPSEINCSSQVSKCWSTRIYWDENFQQLGVAG